MIPKSTLLILMLVIYQYSDVCTRRINVDVLNGINNIHVQLKNVINSNTIYTNMNNIINMLSLELVIHILMWVIISLTTSIIMKQC